MQALPLRIFCLLSLLSLAACSKQESSGPALAQETSDKASSVSTATASGAEAEIVADLHRHIKTLASDEFEGRAPATAGEEKTIAYLLDEYQKLGLKPGNGDSWYQNVPVTESVHSPTPMRVTGKGQELEFEYRNDMMVFTQTQAARVSVEDSDMVFAGYGIVAPEYGWNDYEGIDVKGKTVVVLVNDPGFATEDPAVFKGRTMTYYGRWTYKYEEAARQGAAAVLIVHETAPAAYPWAVVSGSWGGPQIALQRNANSPDVSDVEGWLSIETTEKLFTAAGLNYQELKTAAAKPGFKAVPMEMKLNVAIDTELRGSDSRNFLAMIPGTERPDEFIIFTAHWDHLGVKPTLGDDKIHNGAVDNATGTAALMAIARQFQQANSKPERSLLFLSVTAEESGLLGSKFYAENPVYPHNKTVAIINMDAMGVLGKMKDVVVYGLGSSELEDYLKRAAEKQGRYLVNEPTPEKGYFYRSDHFSFAKQGIPALYAEGGIDHAKGKDWVLEQQAKYTQEAYHKPADEYDPNWDLSGTAEDVLLYIDIATTLAGESTFPNWYPNAEFRSIRDRSMAE